MKNALLVCDNRDVPNWGCRATSLALHALLDRRFGVSGRVGRLEVLRKEAASALVRRAGALMGGSGLAQALRNSLAVRDDYVTGDIEASARTVLRERHDNPFFESLVSRMETAGLVVVNGEGSMVFKLAERRDLRFQLLCLELARQLGKPAFYVNAMISDFPGAARNYATWEKCRDHLSRCTGVQVRDRMSFGLLEEMDVTTRISVLPDALFSTADGTLFPSFHPADMPPQMLAPYPEQPDRLGWRFDQPYVCVSGSSYFRSRRRYAEARDFMLGVVGRIRDAGLIPVFVATCTGDAFLEPLAREAGVCFVPVETNIFVGAAILGNAAAFVSGRYHPTILATLGGTPCVFMESNSHKMASLRLWLEDEAGGEGELSYRDPDVIEAVEAQVLAALSGGRGRRERLRQRARTLGLLAATIPDQIDPRHGSGSLAA